MGYKSPTCHRSPPEYNALPLARVALNDRDLENIHIPIYSRDPAYVSCIGHSIESHRAIERNRTITLYLPAVTALQLYHEGALSTDPSHTVEITIAGKSRGHFFLGPLSLPPSQYHGDAVLLEFLPTPRAPTPPPRDPNAWLLDFPPLQLIPAGLWDPAEEGRGEGAQPIPEWAQPIAARGPRPQFEIQRIVSGTILKALAHAQSGRRARASDMLERLAIKDMRCFDARAHLGRLYFEDDPRTALSHYETAVQIGQHTLGLSERSNHVIGWKHLPNRPFFRCLQGYALALWRLRRFEEASDRLEQLLWLNPSDQLGIHLLLPPVRTFQQWTPSNVSTTSFPLDHDPDVILGL